MLKYAVVYAVCMTEELGYDELMALLTEEERIEALGQMVLHGNAFIEITKKDDGAFGGRLIQKESLRIISISQ